MNRTLFLFAIVIFSGCTTTPNIPISGQTLAVGTLGKDVFEILPVYAGAVSGCKDPIQNIRVELLEFPMQIEYNEEGIITKGTFKELWYLNMCGKEEKIYIKYTPDMVGGTYINFSTTFGEF